MIKLHNICKSYLIAGQTQPVLNNINLQIAAGELLAIMGPSGSGKSTLMNILGLLDRPSNGHYLLFNRDVLSHSDDELAGIRNRHIGFVFQSFYLLPRFSALQNVCLPLLYRGMDETEMRKKALLIMEKVGMADKAHYKPNQLSGGQQQRIAIARALIGNPALILADEPTGALDSHIGQEILDLFIQLHRNERVTVVIVTHDPRVAKQCLRILHVNDGELSEQ